MSNHNTIRIMKKIMELEKMDKAYGKSKQALDKSSKLMMRVEALNKDIKNLKRQLENIEIEIIRANEDGDKAKAKTLQESKKAPKKELEAKKQELQKLQPVVEKNQATIDEKMSELSQDPALKAHLEEVIGKKFSRKLSKIQKDKEDIQHQNEPLMKIREAAKLDPNVMYSLKEIEKYTKLIAENKDIIADKTKSAAEIAKAQSELPVLETALNKTRGALAAYFKGTISREVIDKITSYEDLGKTIKANEKQLKGLEKQTANYETALENIGFASPLRENSVSDISDTSSSTTRTSSRADSTSRTARSATPSANLPAEQPKWYQFIKRFKNWNARRKAEVEKESEEPTPVSQEEKSKFKNSMKYDIVKDYEEKVAENLLKQAKQQNKEAADRDRDE